MCLYPVTIADPRYKDGEYHEAIQVPCGKCIECLQARSNEWAHRIVDECQQHVQNCFITLTYDNEHKPSDGSVSKRAVQLFIKRLRKALEPVKIRYFACGEYGSKHLRPHYHLIIFGWFPDDAIYWETDKKKCVLYRSPLLEKVWPFGFSTVGKVTLDSAKYCAKYLQKFNRLPDELPPAFILMSNRNGIGYGAIDPHSLTSDRLYHGGKSVKIPRYYLKVLEREGHDLTEFKERRVLVGKLKERTREQLQKSRKKFNYFRKKY